jgi:ADP-heptose:LPS heptosyltransferase
MASGTPTVAVFGPTDPGQFDFEGHELVYADLPCSACSFFGSRRCRLGHWRCMRAIPPEVVLAASRRLLSRGGTPA